MLIFRKSSKKLPAVICEICCNQRSESPIVRLSVKAIHSQLMVTEPLRNKKLLEKCIPDDERLITFAKIPVYARPWPMSKLSIAIWLPYRHVHDVSGMWS